MPARIRLLGSAEVWRGDGWQPLPRDKRGALLIHLAHRGDWVERERLAFLFWPERQSRQARRNLRQLLRRVKTAELADLEITDERLRWTVDSDAAIFLGAAEAQAWPAAIEAYRGDFCRDFATSGAPAFERWLVQTREELKTVWQTCCLARAETLGDRGDHREALALLERLWESDDLDEQNLIAYLRAAERLGERDRAFAAYRSFATRLETELGLAPLPTTTEIARTLREGGRPRDPAPGGERLPTPATPFCGRERELRELAELLHDPDCRLLALVGPGGIGKSRLALELAAREAHRFAEGAVHIDLSAVEDPDGVAPALATGLGLEPSSGRDPALHLLDHLRSRQVLILLDHSDRLLAADLPLELLEQAPGVKLLLTTREAPDLLRAWLYRVGGLAYPDTTTDGAELAGSDAALLFRQATRGAEPTPPPDERLLLELFRLTDGSPLALELAAASTGRLGLERLVGALQDNIDLLDGSEERPGLRAAFLESWTLLTGEQQRGLAALSVFVGGFDRRAAQAVAGAGLYLLLGLAGKSLLAKEDGGRYRLHALLREYAAERLGAERGELLARHARHYLARAEAGAEALKGEGQTAWLDAMERDHANLRAALQRQLEHGGALPSRLLLALSQFWRIRGHLREAAAWFERALQRPVPTATEVELRAYLGRFVINWDPDAARRHFAAAYRSSGDLGDRAQTFVLLHYLAHVERISHRYRAARERFGQALDIAAELGDPQHLAMSIGAIADMDTLLGDLESAREHYRRACEIADGHDDRHTASALLDGWALATLRSGDVAAARARAERGRALAEAVGDAFHLAQHDHNLALIARAEGNGDWARRLLERSLAGMRDIDQRGSYAPILQGLAAIACDRHDWQRAAFLFGAAAGCERRYGGADWQHDYRAERRRVRERLGAERFEALLGSGADSDPEAAVAYALHGEAAERPG